MKIVEYIELVKQADFNSSYSAGDAFAGKPQDPSWVASFMEGQAERENSTPVYGPEPDPRGNPYERQKPEIEPDLSHPEVFRRSRNGFIVPFNKRFRVADTLKRFKPWSYLDKEDSILSPEGIRPPYYIEPRYNPAEGRSWPKYVTDFGNREAWKNWWEYKKQGFKDGLNLERGAKSSINELVAMPEVLRAPVKPVDFGAFHGWTGKAFPVLLALDAASQQVEQNASDNARIAGINPDEDSLGYLRFYYPELFKELYRSSPNILTEGISFLNPVSKLTMTGELSGMPLRAMGYKGRIVPGFYHPHYDMNRIRSDLEWENSWNPELIHPDLIKQNVERYGDTNYWIDNAAAYGDPVAQTAGWLIDNAYKYSPGSAIGMTRFVTGNPYFFGNKPTYEYIMDVVGDLADKPTKYDVDEMGTKTVDWQDFANDSGWYALNGGRPEFRNMPREKRIEQIQPMIIAAIKNGYTKKQIDQAVDLYIKSPGDPDTEAGSLAYKEGNLLQLMAMPPSEIYGSMAFLSTATNPEDISGIPRYIKRFIPGTGPFSPGGSVVEENPKWTEAKKSLERRIADQQTLFRRFPFFAALQGRDNQLSEEEEAFLNNEKSLAWLESLEDADIPKLEKVSQEDFNGIPADLRKQFEIANLMRQVSRLPVKQRYALLYWDLKKAKQFIDRYYTNEETKSRLRKFLGVPEPKTTYPEVESAATQMRLILPILQKARQRAEEIQRRNLGM